MNLTRFARRRYTPFATPIQPLPRLSAALGGPSIFVKRDDLLGLAGGGNKTRKLEFLVAAALAEGADTLITCGAVQSNHCRLTLAAAVQEGLACQLVLEERVPGTFDPGAGGNNFLYDLLGVEAKHVVPGGTDLGAAMARVAADLHGQGRRAYVIPGGGSNPLGSLGYVACADELLSQSFDMGLRVDHVVCASGSGGTHAGLLAGLAGCASGIPVAGISVRNPRERQEAHILELASRAATLAGADGAIDAASVEVDDSQVGPGYSLPTPAMTEAVQLLARTEGILLDPVYTGKTMAGLLAMVRDGRWGRDQNVLFVHTGGTPSLFHYRDQALP